MYPILISIFFYFQQLDCRQILSGKMINAILFIFYQEVMKQKMNKPFDIHRNIQKTIEIDHFTKAMKNALFFHDVHADKEHFVQIFRNRFCKMQHKNGDSGRY